MGNGRAVLNLLTFRPAQRMGCRRSNGGLPDDRCHASAGDLLPAACPVALGFLQNEADPVPPPIEDLEDPHLVAFCDRELTLRLKELDASLLTEFLEQGLVDAAGLLLRPNRGEISRCPRVVAGVCLNA